jgi:hypothetical protein
VVGRAFKKNSHGLGLFGGRVCFFLLHPSFSTMFRGKKKSKKETEPIPTTIDGFGYVIKENGTVRSKTTGTPHHCCVSSLTTYSFSLVDSQYVFDFEPKNQTYNETRYRVFVGKQVNPQMKSMD